MKLKNRNAKALVFFTAVNGQIIVYDQGQDNLRWRFNSGTSLYEILEVVTK